VTLLTTGGVHDVEYDPVPLTTNDTVWPKMCISSLIECGASSLVIMFHQIVVGTKDFYKEQSSNGNLIKLLRSCQQLT